MPLDQQHEHDRRQNQRGEMSFFEHIAELRTRILRSMLAISVFAIISLMNKDFVFGALIFGPRNADFPTYRILCSLSHSFGMGDKLCIPAPTFKILPRELGEVIMEHLYISFWLGVICAFPYIFWEFWKFIRPGLLEKEQKAVRGVVLVCSLLFLTGIMFGYYVIAPFSISFLANYTVEGMDMAPSLDSYVTYIVMFTIPTGLVFEMPVIAYFLAKVGLISPQFLRQYRRHAVVGILILAAIITPPDVVAQTIVSIPLYLLYELSIIVVGRVQRQRENKLKQKEQDAKALVIRDRDEE
jgi:sec-independent protein translocase protein TatC